MTVNGSLTPMARGQDTLTFRLEYESNPVTSKEVRVEARLPAQELGPRISTPSLTQRQVSTKRHSRFPWKANGRSRYPRIDTYTQPTAIITVNID